jgi:hypothetical protein
MIFILRVTDPRSLRTRTSKATGQPCSTATSPFSSIFAPRQTYLTPTSPYHLYHYYFTSFLCSHTFTKLNSFLAVISTQLHFSQVSHRKYYNTYYTYSNLVLSLANLSLSELSLAWRTPGAQGNSGLAFKAIGQSISAVIIYYSTQHGLRQAHRRTIQH